MRKLKFILLPHLIATVNHYAYSLPTLMANVSWSAFQSAFGQQYKSITHEIIPMKEQWGPDNADTVSNMSVYSGMLAHCGYL